MVEDIIDTGPHAQLPAPRAARPQAGESCGVHAARQGRSPPRGPADRVPGVRASRTGSWSGYGLDLDGVWRNLPYVATLHDEVWDR